VCYGKRVFPVKSLFSLGLGLGGPPVDRQEANPKIRVDYNPGNHHKPDFGLRARPAHCALTRYFAGGRLVRAGVSDPEPVPSAGRRRVDDSVVYSRLYDVDARKAEEGPMGLCEPAV